MHMAHQSDSSSDCFRCTLLSLDASSSTSHLFTVCVPSPRDSRLVCALFVSRPPVSSTLSLPLERDHPHRRDLPRVRRDKAHAARTKDLTRGESSWTCVDVMEMQLPFEDTTSSRIVRVWCGGSNTTQSMVWVYVLSDSDHLSRVRIPLPFSSHSSLLPRGPRSISSSSSSSSVDVDCDASRGTGSTGTMAMEEAMSVCSLGADGMVYLRTRRWDKVEMDARKKSEMEGETWVRWKRVGALLSQTHGYGIDSEGKFYSFESDCQSRIQEFDNCSSWYQIQYGDRFVRWKDAHLRVVSHKEGHSQLYCVAACRYGLVVSCWSQLPIPSSGSFVSPHHVLSLDALSAPYLDVIPSWDFDVRVHLSWIVDSISFPHLPLLVLVLSGHRFYAYRCSVERDTWLFVGCSRLFPTCTSSRIELVNDVVLVYDRSGTVYVLGRWSHLLPSPTRLSRPMADMEPVGCFDRGLIEFSVWWSPSRHAFLVSESPISERKGLATERNFFSFSRLSSTSALIQRLEKTNHRIRQYQKLSELLSGCIRVQETRLSESDYRFLDVSSNNITIFPRRSLIFGEGLSLDMGDDHSFSWSASKESSVETRFLLAVRSTQDYFSPGANTHSSRTISKTLHPSDCSFPWHVVGHPGKVTEVIERIVLHESGDFSSSSKLESEQCVHLFDRSVSQDPSLLSSLRVSRRSSEDRVSIPYSVSRFGLGPRVPVLNFLCEHEEPLSLSCVSNRSSLSLLFPEWRESQEIPRFVRTSFSVRGCGSVHLVVRCAAENAQADCVITSRSLLGLCILLRILDVTDHITRIDSLSRQYLETLSFSPERTFSWTNALHSARKKVSEIRKRIISGLCDEYLDSLFSSSEATMDVDAPS